MIDLEQFAAVEKERVARLINQAADEIDEDGGDFHVFTIALMRAAVHLLAMTEGDDAIAEMITRIALFDREQKGLKSC